MAETEGGAFPETLAELHQYNEKGDYSQTLRCSSLDGCQSYLRAIATLLMSEGWNVQYIAQGYGSIKAQTMVRDTVGDLTLPLRSVGVQFRIEV